MRRDGWDGKVSKGVYLNEPEVWSGNAGRIAGHKAREAWESCLEKGEA